MFKFPRNFLFGFSESGFQFEMGIKGSEDEYSDWWSWVHDEENMLAAIVSGDLPENGPGYWDLYKKDHEIANVLGMNAARLGIEWSRIFPKPTWDIKVSYEEDEDSIISVDISESILERLDAIADKNALKRYREIFEDWKLRNKFLIINLSHFTLPIWIHDPISMRKYHQSENLPKGWVDKKTVIEFAKYASYIAWKFDDLADMWSTLNEPNVVYGSGFVQIRSGFPPGILNLGYAISSAKHLAEAHARAYDNIKSFSKKPVGLIYAVPSVEPRIKNDEKHEEAARIAKDVEVFDLMNLLTKGESKFIGRRKDLANHIDWIGINYYSRIVIEPSQTNPGFKELDGYGMHCLPNSVSKEGRECSDFGWEIYPEGLFDVINEVWKRYNKPMLITENGIADAEDKYRGKFIMKHLYQVQKALNTGVNLRGYFHWALTDNYEWAKGFKMKFGLCYVDYETKKRYLRPSALILREIISQEITKEFELMI